MEVLRFALLGIGLGGVYALLALGLVAIHRGSGVLNMAQGAMGTVGAYVFFALRDEHGWATAAAFPAAIAGGAILGVVVQLLVMRPMARSAPVARLVATLGVVAVVQGVAEIVWGSNSRLVATVLPARAVEPVDGLVVGLDRLLLAGLAAVLAASLAVLYRRTRFGTLTSGVAQDSLTVAVLGRSPDAIAATNWALGGALATIAVVLVAPISGLSPAAGTLLVIPALAAAVIGGFSSFALTLLGGFALGIANSELTRYVSTPGWGQAAPLIAILVVLVLRGRAVPDRGAVAAVLPAVGLGRPRPAAAVLAAVAVVAALYLLDDAQAADALIITVSAAVVGLSLVVLMGYAGQLSLAQLTLGGFGAWIATRLVAVADVPFPLAAAFGVLGAVPVGALVAIPAVRVRGVTLAVATIAFGIALQSMVLGNPNLTGGLAGTDVGSPSLFGLDVGAIAHPERYAAMSVAVLVVLGLWVVALRSSRIGHRLLAVRSNERAAAALGIDPALAKLYAFSVSAAIAACGAILLAFRTPIVDYDAFGLLSSLQGVVLTVIGGVGFALGPVVGGTLAASGTGDHVIAEFIDVREWLVPVTGALLLLTLVVRPDGVAALFGRRRGRSRREPLLIDDSPAVSRKPAALSIDNVTVVYGNVVAVSEVTLEVAPGEVVGLIGPNGAGKTSLIDAITGYAASTGQVALGDRRLDSQPPHRRSRHGLGRVFQGLELFDDLTLGENIAIACDPQAPLDYFTGSAWVRRPMLTRLALDDIERLGLAEHLDTVARDAPLGVRRLAAICRALATDPAVLLLDEPAAGLASVDTEHLGGLIKDTARTRAMGVLIIEHDVELVFSICDRVAVLVEGSVLVIGAPEDLRRDERVVTSYLGARQPNHAGSDAKKVVIS